jgi:hypothetical protein
VHWHDPAYTGLFTDNHALQHFGVFVVRQITSDLLYALVAEGVSPECGVEDGEGVSDLVDALFGRDEQAACRG